MPYKKTKVTKRLNELLHANPTMAEDMAKRAFEIIDHYDDQIAKGLKDGGTRAGAAEAMLPILDEAVEKKIVEKFKDQLSCRRGCSHCCHQRVDTTIAEAELILDWTDRHNVEIDWERAEQQKDWEVGEYITQGRENAKCIFLKNNECSIYEVRPAACRKYFVVTPAQFCDFYTYPKFEVACPADITVESIATAIAHLDNEFQSLPKAILIAGETEAPE